MRRIAIMPARGGSKRIPHKNIVDFCGRPLLTYALSAAGRTNLFDIVHVSTDDADIAATAAQHGFAPEFLRDPALADDHTPLLPVLQWVLTRYEACGVSFDSVCLLMPTAPLIDETDLRGACQLFDQHRGNRAVMAISTFPCPVEWALRCDENGELAAIQPGMDQVRSQDLRSAYYDSGTFSYIPASQVMAYPAPQPMALGYRIPRFKAVDIDDYEDLAMAEIVHRGLNRHDR